MNVSEIAKELGKLGGKKTKELHTKEEYRVWQKKSVASRLKNKKLKLKLAID